MWKVIGAGLIVITLVVVVTYGFWQFKRWWNYSWAYEAQVQSTVCEMIKPEYLKNPEQCK